MVIGFPFNIPTPDQFTARRIEAVNPEPLFAGFGTGKDQAAKRSISTASQVQRCQMAGESPHRLPPDRFSARQFQTDQFVLLAGVQSNPPDFSFDVGPRLVLYKIDMIIKDRDRRMQDQGIVGPDQFARLMIESKKTVPRDQVGIGTIS